MDVDVYKNNQLIADKNNSILLNLIIPPKTCLLGDNSSKWIKEIMDKNLNSLNHDLTTHMCNKEFFAIKGAHFSIKGYEVLSNKIYNIINIY